MIFKQNFKFVAFCITLLFLASNFSYGWSIFSSKEDKLKEALRDADKTLTRADVAYENADYKGCVVNYQEALKYYEQINKEDPTLMKGLPAIRIKYCASQITNSLFAINNYDPKAQSIPEIKDEETSSPEIEEIDEVEPYKFATDFSDARQLLFEGELDEASDILIDLLRQDPANRSVRMLISIVRVRQGKVGDALVALDDLRGTQEDLPLLLAISGANVSAGHYHEALLALDKAVKLYPKDPNAYVNLAWLTLIMPGSGPAAIEGAKIYYNQALSRGAVRDLQLEKRIGLR